MTVCCEFKASRAYFEDLVLSALLPILVMIVLILSLLIIVSSPFPVLGLSLVCHCILAASESLNTTVFQA